MAVIRVLPGTVNRLFSTAKRWKITCEETHLAAGIQLSGWVIRPHIGDIGVQKNVVLDVNKLIQQQGVPRALNA